MNQTALQYHTTTSYDRHAMQGHHLRWNDRPSQFKTYPNTDFEPIALPNNTAKISTSLFTLSREPVAIEPKQNVNLSRIGMLLKLTNRITAESRHGGEPFYYRSVASAGALYPNELYLAGCGIDGLIDGIYHYDMGGMALNTLRKGDFSVNICAATRLDRGAPPIATVIISGLFYRSAWKYRARAYRYVVLDAGHILGNLLLAANVLGLKAKAFCDFEDNGLNHLLGLDSEREVCLTGAHIWLTTTRTTDPTGKKNQPPMISEAADSENKTLPGRFLAASRVARNESSYTPIREIHAAGGRIHQGDRAATDWLEPFGGPQQGWLAVPPVKEDVAVMGYGEAVQRRRSRRNFIPQPIKYDHFAALFTLLAEYSSVKNPASPGGPLVQAGALVSGVDTIPAGGYRFEFANRKIGCVFRGAHIADMTDICLNQQWLQHAAIHFLFMANLKEIDRLQGARGYRYALLEAGKMAQMIYLGATALGLGCCGIGALYDNEARSLLGLDEDSALLYLVAVGSVKRL